jgi:hypothetical protein
MKSFALSVLTSSVLACLAGALGTARAETVRMRGSVLLVDWQYPPSLPPGFRNRCSVDFFSGRPYCSDHCGSDYQFFYCSEESSGCCHLGRGYCAVNGVLRCSP